MKKLKKLYKKLKNARHQRARFRRWSQKNIPAHSGTAHLTEVQKKMVDSVWKEYRLAPSYGWHELYLNARQTFEPEMVPSDSFYMNLLPRLNFLPFKDAWNDKSYLSRHLSGLPIVPCVVICIDGRYYTNDYQPLTLTQAAEQIRTADSRIIVKPSCDHGQGKGIEIFETQGLTKEAVKELSGYRNGNCVFQKLVQQCELFSKLNGSSLNIVRINSLRLGNEIHTLNATIRFGTPGSITDVSRDAAGNEILNLLGITDDGKIMDRVYSIDGSSTPVENYGISAGTQVEGFQEMIEISRKAHMRLQHFDFIGFDITLDSENKPVIIEANFSKPGIFAYQYVHGPLFREYLSGVLEFCSGQKEKK